VKIRVTKSPVGTTGSHPEAIPEHFDVELIRDREFPIRRPNSGPCLD
jgi:hypothetical protein